MTIPFNDSDQTNQSSSLLNFFFIIEFTLLYQKEDKTKFTANNTVNYIYIASMQINYITRLLTKKTLHI